MSTITISDVGRMSRESLAAILVSRAAADLAVVDVRDSDHIGGHIRSSMWVPSNELDYKTAELVRTLKDKQKVVFHCTLSQQRGPSAALKYARERHRLLGSSSSSSSSTTTATTTTGKNQEVYVLDGGFNMWQAKYGEDVRVTEGYIKELWEI